MTPPIDAVTLQVVWQRLISIMDEVDDLIVRTTFSTILSEGRDFACILTDPQGRSLCQSSWSTPNFCVVLPRTARLLLERFPVSTLAPGDVLATNDPWLATGHLPDYVLLMPLFVDGRLIAFLGTVSHMSDVGGHPGEIEGDDVYAEGLCMPPFKLYEGGVENATAFDVIGANCRAPDLLLGDLRAMAGAAHVAARRFAELLASTGAPDLSDVAQAILERSERLVRERIARIPDGTYTRSMEIDGYVDTVTLAVTVTVEGSGLTVDYAGSSLERRGAGINVPLHSTIATTMYPFKCALVPDVPNNEGLFRPIEVRAPEGSILNARFPAPVKARAKTTNNLNQVLFAAMCDVFGTRTQASNGGIWPLVLKGRHDGRDVLVDMLPYGGRGAMPASDGMVPVAFPTNSTITPCEVVESRAPVLFRRKEFRTDSFGRGRFRGGLGQTIEFRHVGDDTLWFSLTPDRITTAPGGLSGGDDAPMGRVQINGVTIDRFPAIALSPGDTVRLELPGGGGFGPASQRSTEAIAHDIAFGYASSGDDG